MAIYKFNHPARRKPRASVEQVAWLAGDEGQLLGSCIMVDVSASGAKLQFPAPIELPENFVLVLSKGGRVRRPCRLVWHSDGSAGVQFLKAAELKKA
jgi:hypothetical protein